MVQHFDSLLWEKYCMYVCFNLNPAVHLISWDLKKKANKQTNNQTKYKTAQEKQQAVDSVRINHRLCRVMAKLAIEKSFFGCYFLKVPYYAKSILHRLLTKIWVPVPYTCFKIIIWHL